MQERFTIVKRGYSPEEVDEYIQTLEQVIKSYKEKDNAIKNAIVNAQLAADNIVKNAHLQSDEMRNQVMRQLDGIINSVGRQRTLLQEFQEDYNALMRRYITDVNDKDIMRIYGKISDLEEFIAKFGSTSGLQDQDLLEDSE